MVGTRGIELSMEKWWGEVDEAEDRNSCLRDGSTVHECAVVSPGVTYARTATKYSVSLRFLPRSGTGIAFCRDTGEYPWPVSFLCTFVFYGKTKPRSILLVGRVHQSIAIATRTTMDSWPGNAARGFDEGIRLRKVKLALVESIRERIAILCEDARFNFGQTIFKRSKSQSTNSLRRVKVCIVI